jgi:plastocyanin
VPTTHSPPRPLATCRRTLAAGLTSIAALTATACAPPGDSTQNGPSRTATATTRPPGTTPAEPETSTPDPSVNGTTIRVSVEGNKVSPKPRTVDLATGATLTLIVTSDVANTVHAHGFDVSKDLTAGEPTELTLTGGQPGLYEIETHDPSLRLLKIAVR